MTPAQITHEPDEVLARIKLPKHLDGAVRRDHWKNIIAEDRFDFGLVEADPADSMSKGGRCILTVSTKKAQNGRICTYASVSLHSDGWSTHMAYQDYNTRCLTGADGVRATERNVLAQHNTVIGDTLEALTEAVNRHYKIV